MKIARLIFAVPSLFVAMADARAALTFSLDTPVVNSATGNTLVFTGTLTNTDSVAQVFLNDFALSAPADLTLQPNTFFANVPGILLPGESYSGPIFSVTLGAGATSGDYACTAEVDGGADIFTTGQPAIAGFTVLSPVITIAASVPDASEFGPVSGAFTVSRTGGTDIPLPVSFTIGGSAVNGSSCTTIASPSVIAAGSTSGNVAVVPIPDNIAEGDRTVLLTLTASTDYNLGAATAATVTIHDKPADQWRLQNFGAAANTAPASDTASWAKDGVANLTKYGLGMDPTVSNVSSLPQPVIVDGYLTLSFVPNPAALDLAYTVEGSSNVTLWNTTDVEAITLPGSNLPNLLTYRYRIPVDSVPAAFLRLRIDRQQ